jgi:ABC-type nitrate/sulfonate/bicarbonate transport system permease component
MPDTGSCSWSWAGRPCGARWWALSLAVVVGIAIGMVMGFSRTMRDALYPLLVGFNAIPKATVVPIVALMFVGSMISTRC